MPFLVLPSCGKAPSGDKAGPGWARIEGKRNTCARFLLD